MPAFHSQFSVDSQATFGDFSPGEAVENIGPSVGPQPPSQGWVAQQLIEAVVQRANVARWDEKASLAILDDLG